MIVALPVLFSYLFYYFCHCMSLHVCRGDFLFIFDIRLVNYLGNKSVLFCFLVVVF